MLLFMWKKELAELPGMRKVRDINIDRDVKVHCHLRSDEWDSAVLGWLNS